jgi:hypothetical protein
VCFHPTVILFMTLLTINMQAQANLADDEERTPDDGN